MGGNKVRKLEFLVAAALRQGADTLVTCGAVQSNHARLTAAAARKAGLGCDLVLVERVARQDHDYQRSGNRLLLDILGATIHRFPAHADEDLQAAMEDVAERVRRRGGRPFIIAEGGGSAVGGLGYAAAALEISVQCRSYDLSFEHCIVGSGSGGTHAGLVAGLHALGSSMQVTGICVRRDARQQAVRIAALAAEIAALLGHAPPGEKRIATDDGALGPGYGTITEEVTSAIQLAARTEGLLLDPVYSGRTMAGLVAMVRKRHLQRGTRVLFIHTGGTPGLFGYREALAFSD